MPQATPVLAA
uniref:Uncharacterized protein n=1 Tax=Anguilla anguilla TaxID=7936 RepID=A0A0E9S1W6_ANGAN